VAVASGTEQKVTPVQKVIQLLEDMVATGVKEKQDEEIQFTKYTGWCQATTKQKKEAIKKGNEMIETLEADIQKFEADADGLAKEISQLDIDITTWEGDEKSTTKVREIERKDYEKTHQDYTESMEALDEGIQVLEKQSGDVVQEEGEGPTPEGATEVLLQISRNKMIPETAKKAIAAFFSMQGQVDPRDDDAFKIVAPEAGELLSDSADALMDAASHHDVNAADKAVASARAALLQVSNEADVPPSAKRALNAFIERSQQHERAELGAPEANAYESQSQGVIDMLQKLYDKFFTEREKLEKVEVDNLHAFKMIAQDLKNQLDFARQAREEKKVAKSKALQEAANSKGDLTDTSTTRDDDVKFLADMTATCEQKASAYEQRQKLRAEELEAVHKAIEIMSGEAVSGGSEKHLPQLLQKTTSFVQLRSSSQSPVQMKVAAYLKKQGTKLNSRVLSAIAMRVGADPFKKVKKMVKDLIVKLMEEANAEADHKGWCDMELATNEKTRTEKSDAVINLTAEIDELEASVAKLAMDIKNLTREIAELDAAVAKATDIRTTEKAKNEVTIKDAVAAQEAVSMAIGVLKDFYDKASTATSLTQTGAKQPEVFSDEPYKGMGGENGGVVGMMEVIQADFERLSSETKSAESEAAKEYAEFMDDARVDKAAMAKDLEYKQKKEQDQAQALEERKTDLAGTQKELDAALAYYDKLKPDCIATPEPYEERVARRKEEIESLQEALRILQGEDVV
jgi:chromosome segregation ATPase